MLYMRTGSIDEIITSELTDNTHATELSLGNLCPLEFKTIRITSNVIFVETKDFLE